MLESLGSYFPVLLRGIPPARIGKLDDCSECKLYAVFEAEGLNFHLHSPPPYDTGCLSPSGVTV